MKLFTSLLLLSCVLPAWADTDLPSRLFHKTSFTEDWSRYPSPDAVLLRFKSVFGATISSSVNENCKYISNDNRSFLGAADPLTGAPAMDQPGEAFANWYVSCLVSYLYNEYSSLQVYDYQKHTTLGTSRAKVEKLTGAKALSECAAKDDYWKAITDEQVQLTEMACKWSSLSPAAKSEMVTLNIRRFVGPEAVVIDLGLATTEADLVKAIVNEVDDYNQKPDKRYSSLSLSGEPLRVIDASKVIEFLINLEDILKY